MSSCFIHPANKDTPCAICASESTIFKSKDMPQITVIPRTQEQIDFYNKKLCMIQFDTDSSKYFHMDSFTDFLIEQNVVKSLVFEVFWSFLPVRVCFSRRYDSISEFSVNAQHIINAMITTLNGDYKNTRIEETDIVITINGIDINVMFIVEHYYFENSDELIAFHEKINSTFDKNIYSVKVRPIGLMLNKIYNPFPLVYQYQWVEIKNILPKIINKFDNKYDLLKSLSSIVSHNGSLMGKYINRISHVERCKTILPQIKTYDLDMERVDKLLASCDNILNKQMLIYLTNLLLQIENSPRMLRKILDLSQGKIDEYLLGPITISDDKKSIEDLHTAIHVIYNVHHSTPLVKLLSLTHIVNMNKHNQSRCVVTCYDNIDLMYKIFKIDSKKYQLHIWFNYPFNITVIDCTLTAIKPQNLSRDQFSIYEITDIKDFAIVTMRPFYKCE